MGGSGNIAMTEGRQRMAKQLYDAGGLTVSDIAKTIGVSQGTLSAWINKQEWYVKKHKPRSLKIIEELGIGKGNVAEANRRNEPNSFVIPWRLPGMNEYVAAINANRQRGASLKRKTEEGIALCAKVGLPKGVRVNCKAQIHMHFVEKDHRRDYDNIRSGAKFILDALQQAGILRGDGQGYLLPPTETYDVDKNNPRVVVTITPHPELPITVDDRSKQVRGISYAKKKKELRYMDDGEIRRSYNAAKDKDAQIGILADLNAVSKAEILRIIGEG